MINDDDVGLSQGQVEALRNLERKQAGETVDWINISDARSLTDLGLALRDREGWRITDAGASALNIALKTNGADDDARRIADHQPIPILRADR